MWDWLHIITTELILLTASHCYYTQTHKHTPSLFGSMETHNDTVRLLIATNVSCKRIKWFSFIILVVFLVHVYSVNHLRGMKHEVYVEYRNLYDRMKSCTFSACSFFLVSRFFSRYISNFKCRYFHCPIMTAVFVLEHMFLVSFQYNVMLNMFLNRHNPSFNYPIVIGCY